MQHTETVIWMKKLAVVDIESKTLCVLDINTYNEVKVCSMLYLFHVN